MSEKHSPGADPNRYRKGKVAVYVRPDTAAKIRAEAARKRISPDEVVSRRFTRRRPNTDPAPR